MIEYKFRGKRIDNGEWVKGLFGNYKMGDLIVPCIEVYKEWDSGDYIDYIEIDGDTVGQYTGLKDKNGVEIYEGDLMRGGKLQVTGGVEIINEKCTVTFKNGMFKLGVISLCSYASKAEVVGNIHEVNNEN